MEPTSLPTPILNPFNQQGETFPGTPMGAM